MRERDETDAPKDAGAHRADRTTGNAGAGRTAPADPIEQARRLRMAAYEMRKKQEAKQSAGDAMLDLVLDWIGREPPADAGERAALLERMAMAAKQDGKDRGVACREIKDLLRAANPDEILRAVLAVYGRPRRGEPCADEKWRAKEKQLRAECVQYQRKACDYGIRRLLADAQGFPASAHEERDPAFGNWPWGFDPATCEMIEPLTERVLPEHYQEGARAGLVGFIRRPLRDEIGRYTELRRITGQNGGLKIAWGFWTDPEGHGDQRLDPCNVLQQAAECIRRNYYDYRHECRTLICIGGQFFQWDGRCWMEKSREAVNREGREFLLVSDWHEPAPKRADVNLDNFVSTLAERVVVEGEVREGMHLYPRVTQPDRNLPAIPDDGLDDAKFLIPLRNGVLCFDPRLDAPRLTPHSPRRLFRGVADWDWPDFGAEPEQNKSPVFDRFLEDQGWPPGSPGTLRFEEMLGLMLSGVMDFHVMGFLQGPPRSGKSLTARLLGRMLPPGWVVYKDVSQITNRFGMGDFARARLVVLEEWSDSGRREGTDVMRFMKQMTGGASIQVEAKHGPMHQARVLAKFLATGNRLPAHYDPSGGAATRVEPIGLSKSATGKEDRELEEKLAREIPAIFLRAFAGLKRLMPDGKPNGKFTQTETSRELKRGIVGEGSLLQAFIAECMRPTPGAFVAIADVRNAYNRFASREKQEGLSEREFARMWTIATGQRAHDKAVRLPGRGPTKVYAGWSMVAGQQAREKPKPAA